MVSSLFGNDMLNFFEIVILKLYPVENINRNVDIYENAQFKKG